MKENSIEENIKKLEEEIKRVNKINNLTGTYVPIDMLEHILSDYKRVLKENEELKNKLDNSRKANEFINRKNDEIRKEKSVVYSKAVNDIIDGWNLGDDFIPAQKVKDKIKELDEEDRGWTEELSEPDSDFKNIDRNLKRIKNQIDVLQELLEGRK